MPPQKAKGFNKRKSLRDVLDRALTLPPEERNRERFELLEDLEEDVAKSRTHRHHAPSTQSRQNFHWEMYAKFLCYLDGKDRDSMTDDQLNLMLFPEDHKKLAHQLSLFVMDVFKTTQPRSRAAATINIRSLCQYRDSMLYWADRIYRLRDRVLPKRYMFNEMVSSMRYAQHMYGDPDFKTTRAWLGLAELRQLLDNEAFHNRCIEVSEEHQVLWCIGRLTALRPGSLCPSGKFARQAPLTWRCLQFTRGDMPGHFEARLTLDHINIKRKADQVTRPEEPNSQPLSIRLGSPFPENLIFSPVHRLLVIALRRGIIQGITNLDELLNGDAYEIMIKSSHLDDTMFCAAKPKGEAIDFGKPLKAHALTEYLQLRGKQVGYVVPLTWYAIRRRAATDMARRIGLQATRIFLGHSADSQTLEQYYLNVCETLDNTSILTEQPVAPGGVSAEQSRNWGDNALNKLDSDAPTRARALGQLTRRLILADDVGPDDTSPSGLKNYRRRVRRFAEQQLFEEASSLQRSTMTLQERMSRKSGLNASKFADKILANAMRIVREDSDRRWLNQEGTQTQSMQELEDPEDEEGALFVGATRKEVDAEANAAPEDDLEAIVGDDGLNKDMELDDRGAIAVEFERDIDPEARDVPVTEADYLGLAQSFMQLLLDNTLTSYKTWKDGNRTCPLCLDDNTISETYKMKQYAQEDKLNAHLESRLHQPVPTWWRRIGCTRMREDERYDCPYCADATITHEAGYKDQKQLVQHVLESNEATTNERHDILKANDGWYEPEFADAGSLMATERSVQKRMAIGKKNLKTFGVDTTPGRELMNTEPLGDSTTIVRGSHPHPDPLSAHHQPFIDTREPDMQPQSQGIPEHLKQFIADDMQPLVIEIPDHLRDHVLTTAGPPRFDQDEDAEDVEMGDAP